MMKKEIAQALRINSLELKTAIERLADTQAAITQVLTFQRTVLKNLTTLAAKLENDEDSPRVIM